MQPEEQNTKPKGQKNPKNGSGKQQKNSRFPLLFLGAVILIYAVVAVFDADAAARSLQTFGGLLRQIIPVLVLVFILMFLIDLFIRPQAIGRHLGTESGIKGWLLAIAAGIIATGPIYVWFSMLADFREKGMRTALAGVFLYARSVKLPFIPVMIYYFGSLYTAVLTAYLILFSVIMGLLIEAVDGPDAPQGPPAAPGTEPPH